MHLTILHVAQPVDGGVARVVVDLVRGQRAAGHRVLLACPPGGRLGSEAAAAGAGLFPWPADRSPGGSTVGEVRRLRRIVRAAVPDVLHLHSAKAGLAGRLAVRGRVPTVFQPHAWSFAAVDGPLAAATLRWERYAARWAGALLCVSGQERADGERAGIEAAWRVVPNGVDLEHHTPADAGAGARRAARAALWPAGEGPGPDAPLAVCVGRLCRQKGQDVLLDAWPQVAGAVPGAWLVLVGGGPDAAALAARARGLPRVRLVGDVPDPRPWLAAADLVVLPSRWEGMALAPLEAMAAARPVLLTDVPGARECLPPGGAAHPPVPPGDPVALAERLAGALADPDACARLGGPARAHVVRRHDVRQVVAQVEAVYRGLPPARSAGRPDSRVPQGV